MPTTLEHINRVLAFQERQQELHRGAMLMQTRTYTEKSNARRAARAAGVDPNLVIMTEDGFTFPMPAEETEPEPQTNGHDQTGNAADPEASAAQMKAAHAEADGYGEAQATGPTPFDDQVDTRAPKDDEGIPAFCKIPPEERKAEWVRNPPKAAPIKETATVAAKSKKGSKADRKSGAKASGPDKTATLLAMLKGKGSTVEAMTDALGWLPHTLRARISRLHKPKSKGGEGIKIERERVDGVTTYRVAS